MCSIHSLIDSSNAKHKKYHENLVFKWVYTTVSSGPQIWLAEWHSNSADMECWSDDFFVGQPGSYHRPVSLDKNLIGFSQCFWVIAEIQLSDQQKFTISRSKKLNLGYKLTTSWSHDLSLFKIYYIYVYFFLFFFFESSFETQGCINGLVNRFRFSMMTFNIPNNLRGPI